MAGIAAAIGYGGYRLWKWWTGDGGGGSGSKDGNDTAGAEKQSENAPVAAAAATAVTIIDTCEVVFRKVLQDHGWGYAIDADTITLDESHYRDSKNVTATAWMVTEEVEFGRTRAFPFCSFVCVIHYAR